MKSHEYQFSVAELGRLLGPPLVLLIGFAWLMRLGVVTNLLPTPWPVQDVDHVILTHQAEASRKASPADLVLIGDSSCLMDASAKQLEDLLGANQRVVNLGSLSYLGMEGCASMLNAYGAANPGHPRAVVVLAHPEMLRGVDPAPQYLRFISSLYAGEDPAESPDLYGQFSGLIGLEIFQNRLLSRALPVPLPKGYGRFYGFNFNLYRFLDQQHGSAVDPSQYTSQPGQGNAEYRLGSSLEPGCRTLRTAVPATVKLWIGITPIPASFAPADYPQRHQRMLQQWAQWMQADVALNELPATLPDALFASTTHLNAQGVQQYTVILSNALKPKL